MPPPRLALKVVAMAVMPQVIAEALWDVDDSGNDL